MRRLCFCWVSRSQVTFRDLRGLSGMLAHRRLLEDHSPRREPRLSLCCRRVKLSEDRWHFCNWKDKLPGQTRLWMNISGAQLLLQLNTDRNPGCKMAPLNAKSSGCRSSSASQEGSGSIPVRWPGQLTTTNRGRTHDLLSRLVLTTEQVGFFLPASKVMAFFTVISLFLMKKIKEQSVLLADRHISVMDWGFLLLVLSNPTELQHSHLAEKQARLFQWKMLLASW